MAGRKPIEKRLMEIEAGINSVMNKLCEMIPGATEDEVAAEGDSE